MTELQRIFKIIGQNVRSARLKKGYSQEKLGFELNSARNYIGCIERAEKCPSIYKLYKIAQALDVELSDLVKDICSKQM